MNDSKRLKHAAAVFVALSLYTEFIVSRVVLVHGFQCPQSSTFRRGLYSPSSSMSSRDSDTTATGRFKEHDDLKTLKNVQQIFAISDLHTDNLSNMQWLKNMCEKSEGAKCNVESTTGLPTKSDVLIIAGDISHELSKLEETLSFIKESLNCHIFFIWGNHEAWIGGQEMDQLGIKRSMEKLDRVKSLCHDLGVHTDFQLVGASNENPAFIVPIESWYDGSLSLDGCEDLCQDFKSWPWVDFKRCVWPDDSFLAEWHDGTTVDDNVGSIPLGLTQFYQNFNRDTVETVRRFYLMKSKSAVEALPGLITYSHFLLNQQTLPDWKDPSSDIFMRDDWLDHPVPEVSAKFAKVAGSNLIDEQIRSIVPATLKPTPHAVQHLHVFGHSHRPKDFVMEGIRYIHNPLGKPAERDMKMVSENVGFQKIWDCTKSSNAPSMKSDKQLSSLGGSYHRGGEVPGQRIIRYWEGTFPK